MNIKVEWLDADNNHREGELLQFITTQDGCVMGVVACKLRIVLVHYDALLCISEYR